MALRSVADKPRHEQLTPIQGFRILPISFEVNGAGVIQAGPGMPPQTFISAGANDQDYKLQVPKGNPEKCWVFLTTDHATITASVVDYSTLNTTGILDIDFSAAPAVNVKVSGYICYGTVSGQTTGTVAAALTGSLVKPVISHGQYCAQGMLEDTMMIPLSWIQLSGAALVAHGPLGTTVDDTDKATGVYVINFDFQQPHNFVENWSKMSGATDGRPSSLAVTAATPTSFQVTLTFDDGAAMGVGEKANVLFVGSPKGAYKPNYNAANNGGVHSDLQSRDVKTYSSWDQKSCMRRASFYPLQVLMGATTTGPIEASSSLPPSFRITRTGVGVYEIYIGSFPRGVLADVAMAFYSSDGTDVGETVIDATAGTITVTAAAELADDSLIGWIMVGTTISK